MIVRKVHKLKCVQPYLNDIITGDKTFELRFNDRAYQRGDVIEFYDPKNPMYVGCDLVPDIKCIITYVFSGKPWLADNYVALGLGLLPDNHTVKEGGNENER